MKKSIGLFLILFIFSVPLSAALVSYNGYTLNDQTNIVSGNGHEWLQWDETRNMSISEILDDISDGVINGVNYGQGWQIATNVQMASLFNAFGFNASFKWDTNENTDQIATSNDYFIEDISTDSEKQFITLFGNTYPDYPRNTPTESLELSMALFGQDNDSDGLYNIAIVQDDYLLQSPDQHVDDFVRITADEWQFIYDEVGTGIALVRAVPEPSMLSIFALGLVLGVSQRFRK